MKKFIIIFGIIFIFCLNSNKANSQDTVKFNKNYIGISVSQLLFNDYHLFYERKISFNNAFKIELGYKPQIAQITNKEQIFPYNPINAAWCYGGTAKSYYFLIGYRYFFNKNQLFYLSPELFYKRLEANKIVYIFGLNNNNTNTTTFDIRSMQSDILGVNLLIGKKINITKNEKSNLGLNIFTGFSIRYKKLQTSIYGRTRIMHYFDESIDYSSITVSDTPYKTNDVYFQFSLQLGIEMYFSFK